MSVAIVTGAAGLIGSETCRRFHGENLEVAGIDNDMRARFFGPEASTGQTRATLESSLKNYTHFDADIRDESHIKEIFRRFGAGIKAVVHTAAQPSHDWAAREPGVDFGINATGTLVLLEAAREFCPEAVFIFTSTNKVYGDAPNRLPFAALEKRWELDPGHPLWNGIDETMSLDQATHSLFGASKVAADILVQEYGRYFGMKTVCFRAGCVTGPGHAGAETHGFLAYLMRCAVTGRPYRVFGYQGKQVRDNIHSHDLIEAFWQFFRQPRAGAVYNIGGGRHCNCSVLEAIELCQKISGRKFNWTYEDDNRIGDHIWWITALKKFQNDYPAWKFHYDLPAILAELHAAHSAAVAR